MSARCPRPRQHCTTWIPRQPRWRSKGGGQHYSGSAACGRLPPFRLCLSPTRISTRSQSQPSPALSQEQQRSQGIPHPAPRRLSCKREGASLVSSLSRNSQRQPTTFFRPCLFVCGCGVEMGWLPDPSSHRTICEPDLWFVCCMLQTRHGSSIGVQRCCCSPGVESCARSVWSCCQVGHGLNLHDC